MIQMLLLLVFGIWNSVGQPARVRALSASGNRIGPVINAAMCRAR
jgi:hypothetical protein